MKVIDRPLSRHHFLLSVWACPPHYSVHFGPMMLQRGLWHPIGHVSEVLRETGSHRSGFCSHPPTEADLVIVFVFLCASLCARSHCSCTWLCVFVCECTSLHMCTWSGISSVTAAEHWKQKVGNWWLKKCKVHWRCHVSATQYVSCCSCLLCLQQPGNQWKEMHTSTGAVQHFKKFRQQNNKWL